MGFTAPVEVMAANGAGPGLALRKASYMHFVAHTKNVGADGAADVQVFCDFGHLEFTDNLRHHLGSFNLPGQTFTEFFGLFGANLHRGVTVSVSSFMANNSIAVYRKQSNSLHGTVFTDGTGHSDFARN